MEYTLTQNITANRFEVEHQGLVAFVDYRQTGKDISFLHTEVPRELSGRGIGSFLARNVLEYARKNRLQVKPYCPFIKAYIDRHEEFQVISKFHQA